MTQKDITKRIKDKHWDLRVRRPGFLQSKHIVSEALTQPIKITSTITIHEHSNIWVGNINLYNQDLVDNLLSKTFAFAFTEDPQWPLAILKQLKDVSKEKDNFIQSISKIKWASISVEEKIEYLVAYVKILFKIQKYYAFAVPLTNWCEQQLKESNEALLDYAVQYEMLDVDRMNESLVSIKKAREEEKNGLINDHLRKFAWIKSNYNVIEPYTKDEILNELQTDIHVFVPKPVPKSPLKYLAVALQVGIFLRNRMKEMSQQLWFAHEPFIKQVASDLSISREDALQLRPDELSESLKTGNVVISKTDVQSRHQGFVVGMLDGKAILMTGQVVEELKHFFDSTELTDIHEIKGNIASRGLVIGVAKVIPNVSEIGKLNKGDILVTSMTTPDFVVAMKQAGAIVTDEGGLSCHAAIVSRELKKPCIVGTKIGSKVLKDGDLVEVNADQGIVKILKKKK